MTMVLSCFFFHGGSTMRKEISGYFKNYNFKFKDEWTLINDMHLANPTNQDKHVSYLELWNYVKPHLCFHLKIYNFLISLEKKL